MQIELVLFGCSFILPHFRFFPLSSGKWSFLFFSTQLSTLSHLVSLTLFSVFSPLHYAISSSSSSSPSSSGAPSSADSVGSSSGRHGPRFLLEPLPKVHFLNDSGTVVTCKVAGAPPVRIWWSLSDGTAVSDVHGLRHVRPNGDLVISPFAPSSFRQDIHATVSEKEPIRMTTIICSSLSLAYLIVDLSLYGH